MSLAARHHVPATKNTMSPAIGNTGFLCCQRFCTRRSRSKREAASCTGFASQHFASSRDMTVQPDMGDSRGEGRYRAPVARPDGPTHGI